MQKDHQLNDAVASLLIWHWARLEWPMFDLICSLSPPDLKGPEHIAKRAAELLQSRYSRELRMKWVGWLRFQPIRSKSDYLEGQTILVVDAGARDSLLKEALNQLLLAEPKEIFLLSLFENPWEQKERSDRMLAKGGFYVDSSS